MKKALITGVTGQDGSYLVELLLEKGYSVHGLVRRSSSTNWGRIAHLMPLLGDRLFLHEGDLADPFSIRKVIEHVQPDEVYNLAAMSQVGSSFVMPEYTADIDGMAVLRCLEAVRQSCPTAKFYQASTSELYGKVQQVPQSENTPFYPRSPYGIAKLYAYWSVVNYREAYGLYACNGILFNHESPRRAEAFVSRKITLAAARISLGFQDKLSLGNLDARRDWGYAKDFVEGMWLMLQQPSPGDYVLATGYTTTVRDFVERAFQEVGITLHWDGKGAEEKGIDALSGRTLVEISTALFRPAEVDLLIGDASKAKKELGWAPQVSLSELIALMVQADLQLAKQHSPLLTR